MVLHGLGDDIFFEEIAYRCILRRACSKCWAPVRQLRRTGLWVHLMFAIIEPILATTSFLSYSVGPPCNGPDFGLFWCKANSKGAVSGVPMFSTIRSACCAAARRAAVSTQLSSLLNTSGMAITAAATSRDEIEELKAKMASEAPRLEER